MRPETPRQWERGPAQPNRRRRTGFTLIELLVVIAVIMLLAALSLPVLSRAQRQSRRAQCTSNLRQIGAAIFTYAASNDGFYPTHSCPRSATFGADSFTAGNGTTFWCDDRPVWKGLLGGDWRVLRCPSTAWSLKTHWPHCLSSEQQGSGYTHISSYIFLVNWFSPIQLDPPARTWGEELMPTMLDKGSSYPLVMDYALFWTGVDFFYANHGGRGRPFPSQSLPEGQNALWQSGSVVWYPTQDITPIILYGAGSFRWYYYGPKKLAIP